MAPLGSEILCIGNALVDIFAGGDEELAARYGIVEPVQHIEYEKLNGILSELKIYSACRQEIPSLTVVSSGHARKPHARHRACSLGECNTACRQEIPVFAEISSGGGSANAAKIAGLLGVKVSFAGAIGAGKGNSEARDPRSDPDRKQPEPDEFGLLFMEELGAAGVKLRLSLKNLPTGICLYLNTGSEIRIASSPSAALELQENDISEEEISRAGVILIDGFMLNRPAFVRSILNMSEKYGTVVALDLSSIFIAAEHAAEIAEYERSHPLILFMNEAEAEVFHSKLMEQGINPEFLHLLSKTLDLPKTDPVMDTCRENEKPVPGSPVLVVKLGERGAVVIAGGKIHRAEAQPIVPKETTGAGDAFCAAFLTAWIRGKSIPECAAFGNRAARVILDVTGTRVEKDALLNLKMAINNPSTQIK